MTKLQAEEWQEKFDNFMNTPKIWAAITKTLPNSDDATDFEGWSRGMDKFMRDNEDVLKAWLRK